jgi:hypothetical protein
VSVYKFEDVVVRFAAVTGVMEVLESKEMKG